MHHYIHKTQNYKHMVAELITQIYVGITDYRMSVPFPRKIVFAKSRHALGKSNMPSLKAKPLNYCLSVYSVQSFHLSQIIQKLFFSAYLHLEAILSNFQYPMA